METFVFVFLTALGVVVSAGILFFKGGPGIVGVCSGVMPLLCGAPLALFIFTRPAFKQKFQGIRRSILPALIPVLLASIWFSLLVYDQNPKAVFRRLLSDPIPVGISNIRAYDDSGGFDVEYGLAFETTAEAIDFVIRQNELRSSAETTDIVQDDPPFEYFPDINPDQEWLLYFKEHKDSQSLWFLWVNKDRNTALLKFIGY
ncbi:MAG: hypothetical protein QM730_07160 [Anaerolineales bacterium]